MMRMKRRLVSLTLMFALLLSLVGVPAMAADAAKITYLSLGDSLAAGVMSDKQVGDGFSDYTAKYLEENKLLESYSKEFAVSGYTTTAVLEDLTTKAELQEAVKKSQVISISASANDLLKQAKIDASKGTVVIDPTVLPSTLKTIGENYAKILETIKSLNSDAKVFVIGTYYPFPYLSDEAVRAQLIQVMETLNTTVSTAVTAAGANFVPVSDALGGSDVEELKKYLPNPLDIHPNAEGYKVISGALVEALNKAVTPQPEPSPEPEPTPEPTPVIPMDIAGHWASVPLQALVERNLLALDANGNVNPGAEITRAEAAVILYQSLMHIAVVPENPGFTDVLDTHPAYQAIATLTSYGVFAKAEKFNPDAPMNRVQLAKVVAATYQVKAQGSPIDFTDIPANYWANSAIQAVATNKFMVGFTNGQFMPNKNTTRAELAAVLYRVFVANQTK